MNTVQPKPTTAPTPLPPAATLGPPHTQDAEPPPAAAPKGSGGVPGSIPLTLDEVKTALLQAKETHSLVVEWVRSFDYKVGPLLAADGALVGGCLALLGQQTGVLTPRPITHAILAFTLIPLLCSLLYAILALSPTLRWVWHTPASAVAKPPPKINFKVTQQHLPEVPKDTPLSVLYFGQIALHDSDGYVKAAKAAYLSETGLLDDLLRQTYLNAKIARSKTTDIAISARGLMLAVLVLFICGATFLMDL